MVRSRLLYCLVSLSMILLICTSVSLMSSGNDYSMHKSVFKLILVDTAALYLGTKNDEKIRIQSRSSSEFPSNSSVELHCDPTLALLRVYMYDLPSQFHFGLLGWKRNHESVWPDLSDVPPYPGGLNLQHSIEYWLTLDLLLSSSSIDRRRRCTAVRVTKPSEADIFFVPFFSSLSYNRQSKIREGGVSLDRIIQEKLVSFLLNQTEWIKTQGTNHLIIAHHPNSMIDARRKLGSAMFVLADFGRYPIETANIEKDVIAPYRHLVPTIGNEQSPSFKNRTILAFFRGAIYRKDKGTIRQELYFLLKDERDVQFGFGSIQGGGIRSAGDGMAASKFCLNVAGDTPSSNRLFDAIVRHCVPVIVSDEIELPFEEVLDYSEFCVFVRSSDALKKGFLMKTLRGMSEREWNRKWRRLQTVVKHFEYSFPSREDDAVDMIWKAVARKLPSVHRRSHKITRYRPSHQSLKS